MAQLYVKFQNGKRLGLIARNYEETDGFDMVKRVMTAIAGLHNTIDANWDEVKDKETALIYSGWYVVDTDGENIMRECVESDFTTSEEFNDALFDDSYGNCGQAFVEYTDGKITYAFTGVWGEIIDVEEYLSYLYGENWSEKPELTEMEMDEIKAYAKEIMKSAELMSEYEWEEFTHQDYQSSYSDEHTEGSSLKEKIFYALMELGAE